MICLRGRQRHPPVLNIHSKAQAQAGRKWPEREPRKSCASHQNPTLREERASSNIHVPKFTYLTILKNQANVHTLPELLNILFFNSYIFIDTSVTVQQRKLDHSTRHRNLLWTDTTYHWHVWGEMFLRYYTITLELLNLRKSFSNHG